MKANKFERLQAGGWEVGSAEDFLQLSDEDAWLVALKLSLISAVKKSRLKRKLSQTVSGRHRAGTQTAVLRPRCAIQRQPRSCVAPVPGSRSRHRRFL